MSVLQVRAQDRRTFPGRGATDLDNGLRDYWHLGEEHRWLAQKETKGAAGKARESR